MGYSSCKNYCFLGDMRGQCITPTVEEPQSVTDPCTCGNLPESGACHDACHNPSEDAETECTNNGWDSCKDYCF